MNDNLEKRKKNECFSILQNEQSLYYRIRAHIPSLALGALAAAPHFVELLYGGGHDGGFIGEDARLEVAAAGRFHAHARAREVRAAHVADGLVNDDDFEMHSRAHHPFQ